MCDEFNQCNDCGIIIGSGYKEFCTNCFERLQSRINELEDRIKKLEKFLVI